MALTPCRECGETISIEAPRCPHCGVPNPGTDMTEGECLGCGAEITVPAKGGSCAECGIADPLTPMHKPAPEARSLSVFDFQFDTFATTALIRWLYGIGLVVITLFTILTVGAGILEAEWTAVLLAGLVAPMAVLLLRLCCELGIIIFRIDEHLQEAVQRLPPET